MEIVPISLYSCHIFLIMAILTGMRWHLIVFLVCMSLMIGGIEQLFILLLAVCMSSFQKPLFKSFAHFFKRLFGLLLLGSRSSSHILDSNPFSDIQYFVPFWNAFDSVVSFALQKPFSLMYIFISLPVFSVSYPWNHCQNQCSEDFPLCLLLGILSFQAPTFFINICVALFPFHSTFIHFKLFKTETPEGGPMVLSHDDRPWAFGSFTLEVRRRWALLPWDASWESCICPSTVDGAQPSWLSNNCCLWRSLLDSQALLEARIWSYAKEMKGRSPSRVASEAPFDRRGAGSS